MINIHTNTAPKMPEHIRKKMEIRNSKRKTKTRRKNSDRKIDYSDRATKMELFKRRMNYGAKGSKASNSAEKRSTSFQSYNTLKKNRISKRKRLFIERAMMMKKRVGKPIRTEAFTLHKESKKSPSKVKEDEKPQLHMSPDASYLHCLIKTSFRQDNFFDQTLTDPGYILKDFTAFFNKLNNKDKLLETLLVKTLSIHFKVENPACVKDMRKIVLKIIKVEKDLDKMKKEKKMTESLFKRTRNSRMRFLESEIRSLAKKYLVKGLENAEIIKKDFMAVIYNTTTFFNDFYLQDDKEKLVTQYFNYQTLQELEREKSGFKGNLLEVFENCYRTQLMVNFSQGFVKEAISKITVKQRVPALNKYKKNNYIFVDFQPSAEQAWNSLINLSKLLGLSHKTQLGQLFKEGDSFNYAVIAAMVLEMKEIYLKAFYREKKLKEESLSLEKWFKWMTKEEEIPDNFFEKAQAFISDRENVNKNPLVYQDMMEAYLGSIKKHSDIFFLEDDKSRTLYDLFTDKNGSFMFKFSRFDPTTKEFFENFLSRAKLDNPAVTFKFIKNIIEKGSRDAVWQFLIKDLLTIERSEDPKDKNFMVFIKNVFDYISKNMVYPSEYYTILNKAAKYDLENTIINNVEMIKSEVKKLVTENPDGRYSVNNSNFINRVCQLFITESKKNASFFNITNPKIDDALLHFFNLAKENKIPIRELKYRNEKNLRISANVIDFNRFQRLSDAFMLISTTGPYIPSTKFVFPEKLVDKCSLQLLLGILACEYMQKESIHQSDLMSYFKASIPAMVDYGVRIKIETVTEEEE